VICKIYYSNSPFNPYRDSPGVAFTYLREVDSTICGESSARVNSTHIHPN